MSFNNPKISFCVLFYNQEEYVKETLDSMFLQDYDNYEIIIRDDCSGDNTQDIIKEYLKNNTRSIEVKVEYGKENLGIVKSLNRTLSLASGKYIALQGGDDISLSNRLSESIKLALKYEVDLIGVDARVVNEELETIYESFYIRDEKGADSQYEFELQRKIRVKLEEDIYSFNYDSAEVATKCLGGFGIIFNRQILKYFNGHLPENIRYEDRLLTFLANMNNGSIQYNKVLVLYRRTQSNVSMPTHRDEDVIIKNMNNLKVMETEVCRIQLDYLFNNGYINIKYMRESIISGLKAEYYKNLFQLKSTGAKDIAEKRLFILEEILKNSNIRLKYKIKSIGAYCFPILFRKKIIKEYYLRLNFFGN